MAVRMLPLLASALAVVLALPLLAIGQEGSVGFVEEIRGTVSLRENSGAKPVRLDSRSDLARRLYPGEQVRCSRGGLLRLRLSSKTRIIAAGTGWFTIPRATGSNADPLQRALDEYGRTGGRKRGEALQVFSPSAHSVVLPEFFVIRWLPSTAHCVVSLVIREVEGNEVWRQNDIDSSSGFLDSDAARQALAKYRGQFGLGPLLLKLSDSCGNETSLTFSLLSGKREESLKRELELWNKEAEGVMFHLGRGYVFTSARMFSQAADEYESALMAAPESRDLLVRTILAHRSTGNFAREEQLRKRLPPGTPVP